MPKFFTPQESQACNNLLPRGVEPSKKFACKSLVTYCASVT